MSDLKLPPLDDLYFKVRKEREDADNNDAELLHYDQRCSRERQLLAALQRIAELEKRYEHVKQQAEVWAQEARTQTATVHDCYAACGVTGKATFNGAEPVRQRIANLESELAIARDLIERHKQEEQK